MIDAAEILQARILIVDDQAANIALLQQMLVEAGYDQVTSTMNPQEVCALHRRNRYDLILLDLQMPGMDGFQVMEGLKTNEQDGYLPVLVITAQPGHKLRALKPLAVGVALGQGCLQFVVRNEPAFIKVDQQHLAWL